MTHKWIDQIDELSIKFNDTFGHLSIEQLNWKPDPDTWSIGQNLDHLVATAESYRPTFEALQSGTYKAPFVSKIGFLVKIMGKTILDGSGPDRTRRIRTFSIWEPSQSDITEEIWSRFDKAQLQLQEWIKQSGDWIEKDIVISSPANRNFVYKLRTAFDIIVAHESRHFEQAKEILDLLQNPASAGGQGE